MANVSRAPGPDYPGDGPSSRRIRSTVRPRLASLCQNNFTSEAKAAQAYKKN